MRVVSLRIRIYLILLLAVIIVGVLGLMVLEKLSLLDSFYLTIVTISTVGFGDVHPVTPLGKLLVIGIIIVGVGCFVGLIADLIEYMIDQRERETRLRKMNMIVGVFFSEIGTVLLRNFSAIDPNVIQIRAILQVSDQWTAEDFSKATTALTHYKTQLDSRALSLDELHIFLQQHKTILLGLYENPLLIEHDDFTPLLQAVFHLAEELQARDDLTNLPETDLAHLSIDLNRVYGHLIIEWITYMHHLKKHFPYLFSLAMRTNPFNERASAIVK